MLKEIEAAGLTQAEISRGTGLKQPTISQYTSGKKRPGQNKYQTVVAIESLHRRVCGDQKAA